MNLMKPVSGYVRQTLFATLIMGAICGLLTAPVFAATPNPSVASPGYFIITLHFDSQITATVADKAVWKMPWPVELVDMKCSSRLLGGSATPTYVWTLQAGATNNATCTMVTNATEAQGTITTSTIADEASMTLDYASTGTSPTADDTTVMLIFKRQ